MWVLLFGFVLPIVLLLVVLLVLYDRTHRVTGRGTIVRRETLDSNYLQTQNQLHNAPYDQLS